MTAIETVRKFGKDNVILLNHNISAEVEHADTKRFKQEVADYLGIEIEYANMNDWENKSPLDVCVDINAFKVYNGQALCTNRLKTEPFKQWLKENYPVPKNSTRIDICVIYGFTKEEHRRIKRRTRIMKKLGYITDYPLALWNDRTIYNVEDIGIKLPEIYNYFNHANCIGCINAKKRHWYIVYCLFNHIFEKAKLAEAFIGYSILPDIFLKDIESKFKRMKELGVEPHEKEHYHTFWAKARRKLKEGN